MPHRGPLGPPFTDWRIVLAPVLAIAAASVQPSGEDTLLPFRLNLITAPHRWGHSNQTCCEPSFQVASASLPTYETYHPGFDLEE